MHPPAESLSVVANWRDLRHPQAGGAELVCEELAARLAGAGHTVVVLAAPVSGQPRVEQRNGYTIRRAGNRFTVYPLALLWLLANRRRVTTILDSQNGIPFFTPLVARRRTVIMLMIWHVHQEQFSAYFPRPVAALGRWLETAGCRAVYGRRMIVAVSPSTRQGVRNDLRLLGDIRVIPPGWRVTMGVGQDRFPRAATPTIVSVGRLVPHKRTRLILQAMPEIRRSHPDVVLHIIGSGIELGNLSALIAELGLADCVRIHSRCSDAERDQLLASAWLSINASAGEGWGISVIESNALGVPVLAYSRPGLRDSIRNGITGWLIEEGQPLAGAVTEILDELEDAAIADRFSREAANWAANFTWQASADKLFTAISIETNRLAMTGADRRRQTDVGSIVYLAREHVPTDWRPELRAGDGYLAAEDAITIFLAGADTAGARAAMARVGLTSDGPGRHMVIRVARGADYLLPFSSELPRATRESLA